MPSTSPSWRSNERSENLPTEVSPRTASTTFPPLGVKLVLDGLFLQLVAYHEADDLRRADLFLVEHLYELPVPEDGHPVGQGVHLLHAVGDVQDADALVLQEVR